MAVPSEVKGLGVTRFGSRAGTRSLPPRPNLCASPQLQERPERARISRTAPASEPGAGRGVLAARCQPSAGARSWGGWSGTAKRSASLGNILLAASNPEYCTGLGRGGSAAPLGLPRSAAGFQHPTPEPGSSAGHPRLGVKARLRGRGNSSQSGWSLSPCTGKGPVYWCSLFN